MKIGIDCRLWNETGVGRYIRNLVLNLQVIDKKNEYVLFVLSKDAEEILHFVQNDKTKLVEADIRWHTLEEQIKFPQILNKEKLDLMHFPYFSVPLFYNHPFIVTFHDLIIDHFPTGQASTLSSPIYNLKLLAYKFVISRAAKKAKKIIAPSSFTKKEIVEHLGVDEDKIVVTYEGVDFAMQNSKLPTSLKLRGASKTLNTKHFLYVGNVFPHKNTDRLIDAFSQLGNANVNLVFVGKEDYFYKRLKKKVNEMKISNINFLHDVSDEELSNLYQNALALVMPSLMEGFGLPALEAMANKCLVLASNIPSLKEVCDDAAIYFDPYDIKDIEEKMREVCFNDLNHFSEKIEKGLERAKLFSWRKMAKETLAVYEQAASNP